MATGMALQERGREALEGQTRERIASASTRADRDDLLVYKSIDIGRLERCRILGIPVDNVSRDEGVAVILDILENGKGPQHILFIDPLKLIRMRLSRRLRFIVDQTRLILAEGGGIAWAARRLGNPLKERIPMIAMMMDLVRLAVLKNFTIYLLGHRMDYLEKVFFNLQRSFPGVRIIGRQGGYFSTDRERLVKESLRKSSPDIIFLGMGFPDQELWIKENWRYLSKAVVVSIDESFDILSGAEKKAPDWVQVRGLMWLWATLTRPWLLHQLVELLLFFLAVLLRAPLLRRKR